MKLLIFSDIHGDHKALERLMDIEADHYIAAGDLATWSRGLEACGEILARRASQVWLLPGNHESERDTLQLCRRFGFQHLHGASFRAGAFHVAGLGYSSPTPFNTPGEYTEEEIAERLEPFAELTPLVLVCHCPPKGTPLDQIRPGLHAGSVAVADFLRRQQPVHFICGHIHEAEGVEIMLGSTRAVNAGKRGYLLEVA
jgi:uncharacterized protein